MVIRFSKLLHEGGDFDLPLDSQLNQTLYMQVLSVRSLAEGTFISVSAYSMKGQRGSECFSPSLSPPPSLFMKGNGLNE